MSYQARLFPSSAGLSPSSHQPWNIQICAFTWTAMHVSIHYRQCKTLDIWQFAPQQVLPLSDQQLSLQLAFLDCLITLTLSHYEATSANCNFSFLPIKKLQKPSKPFPHDIFGSLVAQLNAERQAENSLAPSRTSSHQKAFPASRTTHPSLC